MSAPQQAVLFASVTSFPLPQPQRAVLIVSLPNEKNVSGWICMSGWVRYVSKKREYINRLHLTILAIKGGPLF